MSAASWKSGRQRARTRERTPSKARSAAWREAIRARTVPPACRRSSTFASSRADSRDATSAATRRARSRATSASRDGSNQAARDAVAGRRGRRVPPQSPESPPRLRRRGGEILALRIGLLEDPPAVLGELAQPELLVALHQHVERVL